MQFSEGMNSKHRGDLSQEQAGVPRYEVQLPWMACSDAQTVPA